MRPPPIRTRRSRGRAKVKRRSSRTGHVLLDNRHGLVANVCTTAATGTAERDAARLLLAASAPPGSTVGGDKGFDVPGFVARVRDLAITPHVAQKVKGSAIDGRTTRHAGYAISQQKRNLIEQVFGWMKTVGGLRKLRHRGGYLVDWIVTFTAAAYNLIRLRALLARAT
jgi:Transposase DDE domain